MSQMNQSSRQSSQAQQPAGANQTAGRMFPTRNYLSEDVRASTVEMLNRALADTTDLLTQAKAAHWNVKGMEFYGLHQLFDEIAEMFEKHADVIAERATALGGQAMGTVRVAAANSRIPELPSDAVTGEEYVELLAERLAVHDANLFEAINAASEQGDLDTADLLNEVSREVTKHLWFLEAHLQTQPVSASGTGQSQPQSGQMATGQHRQAQQPRQTQQPQQSQQPQPQHRQSQSYQQSQPHRGAQQYQGSQQYQRPQTQQPYRQQPYQEPR